MMMVEIQAIEMFLATHNMTIKSLFGITTNRRKKKYVQAKTNKIKYTESEWKREKKKKNVANNTNWIDSLRMNNVHQMHAACDWAI